MKKKKQFDAPRERLIEKGVEALSMAELIAIILSTGGKNKTVTELSHAILESKDRLGITSLCELDLEDLMNFNGIGEAKAMRLIAALELGKRQSEISINIKKKIGNPEAIFHLFAPTRSPPAAEPATGRARRRPWPAPARRRACPRSGGR